MVHDASLEMAALKSQQALNEKLGSIQKRLEPSGRIFCIECDEPIEDTRLAALPSASTCTFCMKDMEQD